jgi:hypothetical protein
MWMRVRDAQSHRRVARARAVMTIDKAAHALDAIEKWAAADCGLPRAQAMKPARRHVRASAL